MRNNDRPPKDPVGRKYRLPVKHRRSVTGFDVSWEQIGREVDAACEMFWAKRGGRPGGSSFGDTFNFGKGVGV